MELFGPKTRRVIELMGKRADDPEVVALVEELGKKPITGTTDAGGMKHVAVSKQGIDLGFDHDVLNDQFPRIKLKGQSCMPYLTNAWLGAKWEEPPPEDRVAAKLGPARNDCFTLDAARHVEVEVGSRVILGLIQARRIALASMTPSATVGVFLGWAATHGLFDRSRFASHAALLDQVATRQVPPSALVEAFPRGVWDDHLIDREHLRGTAYAYFANMKPPGTDGPSIYLWADLITVFGARKGPYGHDEPSLDEATWDAVDRAAPELAKRFASCL